MQRIIFILMTICLATALLPASSLGEETAPGKKLFMKSKCNSCHTVNSQKIVMPPKAKDEDSDDDWDDDGDEKEELNAPDLSGVGLKHKGEWLHLYLRKKVANDKKRKHIQRFKGKTADRETLVNWLLTLKTPAKKPDAVSK
jgi:hypothetical protein